jgi:chromosome segregation ATPase
VFSIVINSPAPGSERAQLAEAIERFDRAVAHLDRARQAKERVEAEWHAASRAVSAATRSLSEAEATAPSRRLSELLGDAPADGAVTIERLRQNIADAQAGVDAATADDRLIASEISRAEADLDLARRARSAAAGAVLKASPGVAALLDQLHAARRHVATVSAVLVAIGALVPEGTPSHWSARRPDDDLPDLAPQHEWRTAIQALLFDADAALPDDGQAASSAAA